MHANMSSAGTEEDIRHSSYSSYDANRLSTEGSPMMMSPWNQASPFTQTNWSKFEDSNVAANGLIGSLVREEGHIYSLAAHANFLYTGSDSKNIRVWRDMKEFAAFKSNSGLVKAIIICGEKVFTGHQDGKVRVWKINLKSPGAPKRIGTMPRFFDILKCSIKPSNYVEVKRNRTGLWIKHCDAISSLSINEQQGIIYSASWDRTFKVWKIDNSKCLESVKAHEDAVNSVVCGANGMVFTGSADGTVKVWKREARGKGTKHTFVQTLLKQECAVTALVTSGAGSALYCGSSDGIVNYWDNENELTHGGILKGHKLAVLCLAAAGNLVFSGSADKTICVWKKEGMNHTILSVLTGHTGPVKCLTVEKDRDSAVSDHRWVVYSGSLDKSVKVWSVTDMVMMQQPPLQDNSWDSMSSQ